VEIVHFCGFPNKKAIRMDGFHLLAELFLMACGDGALTCFYGIAISIKRVPGENGWAGKIFLGIRCRCSGGFVTRSASTFLIQRRPLFGSGSVCGRIFGECLLGPVTGCQADGH
jgi:hypothetical protein